MPGAGKPFRKSDFSKPEVPVDISSRRELFVDSVLAERMEGTAFCLHNPTRLPLASSPLKGSYATVIKDGGLYRGYYRDVWPGYEGETYDGHAGEITCYAESNDGHEWNLPDLGICNVSSSRGNNVILAGKERLSHNFAPFIDVRPGTGPDERFKALTGTHPGGGLFAFSSGDGINWKRMKEGPVIRSKDFAFDSQNVAFWSEAEGRYVCYFRTGEVGKGLLRTVSRTTSHDFINWSGAVAMEPNLPGEHLYTNQTHPYFRAPHIYIALPTRFMHGRIRGRIVRDEKGSVINQGSTDIMLMSSRAGWECYERLFTEAFIRPGLDPERWENRANYVAQNVVPTGDAEMSIYNAMSGHRYVLRTDGFVSVRAGAREGSLLTRPLTFEGDRLGINFSTAAAGSLKVEIRKPDGTPVPGFELESCIPCTGDTIEGEVEWENGAGPGALSGKSVRLLFAMTECDLYSFRFMP